MEYIKVTNNQVKPVNGDNNITDKALKDMPPKFDNLQEKKESKIDLKELKAAVDKANKVLFKNNTHLQFKVHEKTKDVMVKVINDESGEVLKEFPPEKILDMVAKLWEIAGIFVDEKR